MILLYNFCFYLIWCGAFPSWRKIMNRFREISISYMMGRNAGLLPITKIEIHRKHNPIVVWTCTLNIKPRCDVGTRDSNPHQTWLLTISILSFFGHYQSGKEWQFSLDRPVFKFWVRLFSRVLDSFSTCVDSFFIWVDCIFVCVRGSLLGPNPLG